MRGELAAVCNENHQSMEYASALAQLTVSHEFTAVSKMGMAFGFSPGSSEYALKQAACGWCGYVIRTLLTPDFQSAWEWERSLI